MPLVSLAVHVTVVTPKEKDAGALFVTVTVNMSVAVAVPRYTGVNAPVASAVMFAGAESAGGVVSITLINCFAVAAFPLASVAVQVTVVVPRAKMVAGAMLGVTVREDKPVFGGFK